MGWANYRGKVLSGIVSVPVSPEPESELDRGPEPQLGPGIDVQSLFLLTALAGEDPAQQQPIPQPIPKYQPEVEVEV